ncbi:unnamed protein product [Clavelina lepadiformis]|uniref:Uncharacterized protein n=1 Tax=Clavelina lepadiformis TaxID=159417 RepID=A0ABP0FQM3_CLALP
MLMNRGRTWREVGALFSGAEEGKSLLASVIIPLLSILRLPPQLSALFYLYDVITCHKALVSNVIELTPSELLGSPGAQFVYCTSELSDHLNWRSDPREFRPIQMLDGQANNCDVRKAEKRIL